MNKINPFMQPGSLQEQKERKRARFKVAVISVFGLTFLLMSILLIQGCKKESATDSTANSTPPTDTNMPDTNATLPVPSPATNPPVVNTPVVPPTPPPAPVAPPIEPPSGKEYVVAKGDSFYTIGKKFGVKIKDIQTANPGVEPTKLKVGQKLQIPGASGGTSSVSPTPTEAGSDTYKVKSGDTLGKIAKQNGVSIKALEEANDLKNTKIKVGQNLKLPAKSAAAASTEAPAPVPPPVAQPVAPANTGMPSSPTR